MKNLIFFVVLFFIIISTVIIKNKRKSRYRHVINIVFVIAVLVIAYNIFIGPGYRFNSYSAARANSFIEDNYEWIDMIEIDGNEFHFFFDSDNDKFRTVFVNKLILGYRSHMSTHLYPHYEDVIRTIGSMSVEDNGKAYSAYMVESLDADVKSIAIIDEEGNVLISEDISNDKTTQLAYKYTGMQNSFNCELVALNEDGQVLYYYGYKHGENHLSDDEYKWYAY